MSAYRRRVLLTLLSTIPIVSTFGCAGPGADTASVTTDPSSREEAAQVMGSGGVRIARYEWRASADSSADAMQPLPLLRIERDPEHADVPFYRIASGALLTNGLLAIAHASQSEVLWLDERGVLVRRTGRRGSGPAEFRALSDMWPLDSAGLAVYDAVLRRMTFFDSTGLPVRQVLLTTLRFPDAGLLFGGVRGVRADGRIVVDGGRSAPPAAGVRRHSAWLHVASAAGDSLLPLGRERDGREQWLGVPGANGFALMGISPFAQTLLAASCGSRTAVADNQEYDITLLDSMGSPVLEIVSTPVRTLTTEAHYRAALALAPGAGDASSLSNEDIDNVRRMSVTSALPVLASLRCDEEGSVWVEEFQVPTATSRRVFVYSPDGSRRRALVLTADERLLAARGEQYLVVVKREDGGEVVELRVLPETENEVGGAST